MTGRQPEWWDPITGEHRDLSQFSRIGGRTEIPIRLDQFESGFVVFRRPASDASFRQGENFPRFEIITQLTAPWEIAFDPKWGGPEQIVFPEVEDWSKRAEPGIRHYSGKATYRTTFDCEHLHDHLRYFLSLGRVANIASISINARDLGVAWCQPWRVAIPMEVLRPNGNLLEIKVANLWTNRLIGDSMLPETSDSPEPPAIHSTRTTRLSSLGSWDRLCCRHSIEPLSNSV